MAQRVSDVAAIVGADTFLLTAAIKLVVTTLVAELTARVGDGRERVLLRGRPFTGMNDLYAIHIMNGWVLVLVLVNGNQSDSFPAGSIA